MLPQKLWSCLIDDLINHLRISKFNLQFRRMYIHVHLTRLNLEHQNCHRIFPRCNLSCISIHESFPNDFILDGALVHVNFDIFTRSKTKRCIRNYPRNFQFFKFLSKRNKLFSPIFFEKIQNSVLQITSWLEIKDQFIILLQDKCLIIVIKGNIYEIIVAIIKFGLRWLEKF